MKVLMIDVGGTNVKFMNARDGEMRKIKSGPDLTAHAMAEGVLAATADWEFDCISIGYPGLLKKAHKAKEKQWAILEGVLQEGIAAGYFRPIFVPVLHRLLQGAVHEIMDYDYLLENKTSFDEMIGHITDIVLYGIIARDDRR